MKTSDLIDWEKKIVRFKSDEKSFLYLLLHKCVHLTRARQGKERQGHTALSTSLPRGVEDHHHHHHHLHLLQMDNPPLYIDTSSLITLTLCLPLFCRYGTINLSFFFWRKQHRKFEILNKFIIEPKIITQTNYFKSQENVEINQPLFHNIERHKNLKEMDKAIIC